MRIPSCQRIHEGRMGLTSTEAGRAVKPFGDSGEGEGAPDSRILDLERGSYFILSHRGLERSRTRYLATRTAVAEYKTLLVPLRL